MDEKINGWINRHKFVITVSAIALISLIALKSKNNNTVWVKDLSKAIEDKPFAYVTFG